jgi:hypothetical protein
MRGPWGREHSNAKEWIMRMIVTTLAALGIAGTMTVGASAPAQAQGVYFYGPGIEFGFGRPYYRNHYRYYDNDRHYYGNRYRYSYGWPEHRSYRHGRGWNWD